MAPCSVRQGNLQYCSEYFEYPCRHYDGFDRYDTLVLHRKHSKFRDKDISGYAAQKEICCSAYEMNTGKNHKGQWEKMNIRSAVTEDAEKLLEIYAYYVRYTAISFEYEVPSLEEFGDRIADTLEKYPYLVIEEGGKIKGYSYAGVFKGRAAYDHCCEVTIYLDRDEKGNGYGRALYHALEEELRKIGIINLYACIADPISEDEYLTKNSEHFHRHMGYTKVGEFHKCGYKFDRWYNMIWMEKMIGEHDNLKPV